MNHNIQKIVVVLLVAVVLAIVAIRFVRITNEPVEFTERDTPTAESSIADRIAGASAPRTPEPEHAATPELRSPEDREEELQSPPGIVRDEVASDRDEPATDAEIVEGVLDSVDKLIAAGLAGDVEAAKAVSKPGTSVAEQAPSIREVTSEFPDLPLDVYGGDRHALAVSWLVQVQQPRNREEGYLMFSLEQDESGAWLIEGVDFKIQSSAELYIEMFVQIYEAELLTPDRN